ncbi:MAG: hypothetical protein L3J75_17685 [Methylococcaceae bacterium]|nr:hypothetical protein [Methylococcaceae bacterium]
MLKSSLALPVLLDNLVGKSISPASTAWKEPHAFSDPPFSRDTLQPPVSYKYEVEELTTKYLASSLGFYISLLGDFNNITLFSSIKTSPYLPAPKKRIGLRAGWVVPPVLIPAKGLIFRSGFPRLFSGVSQPQKECFF